MKNVLILIDKIDVSGVTKSLLTLIKTTYTSYNYSICVFSENNDDLFLKKFLSLANIYYLTTPIYLKIKNKFLRNFFYFFYCVTPHIFFRKKIKKNIHDVIIDYKCLFGKFIISSKCKNKIVWIHGDVSTNTYFNSNNFLKNIIIKKELANSNHIICVSKTMKDKFVAKYGFNEKTDYIYNIQDIENIIELSSNVIDDNPLKNDMKNYLCVSRLVEGKGIERLVSAFIKFHHLNPNTMLFIAGSGNLKLLIESYPFIKILGELKNPYPLIKMADFLIIPSLSEAASTVLNESLILGTKVITTDVGSCREFINGDNGIIVNNSLEGIFDGLVKSVDSDSSLNGRINSNLFKKINNESIQKINLLLGCKQKFVYICHTYYQLYISLCKALVDFNNFYTIAISECSTNFLNIKEKIDAQNIATVLILNEPHPLTLSPDLYNRRNTGNFLKRIAVRIKYTKELTTKIAQYININFLDFDRVFLFDDADPIGYYFWKMKIPFILVEDSLNLYQRNFLNDNKKFRFLKHLLFRTRLIYIANGYSKNVQSIEVNSLSNLVDIPLKKAYELPRNRFLLALKENDKKILRNIFEGDQISLGSKNKKTMLLITQCLFPTNVSSLEREIEIYNTLVQKYKSEYKIFIKPHPRDLVDYSIFSSDCVVLSKYYPIEMLNYLVDGKFDIALTIFSTSIDTIEVANKKMSLGKEFIDEYNFINK